MRNLLTILFLLAVTVCFGQRVRQLTDVQVDAAETLYSDVITLSGGPATLSIDMLCTEDGGTTDGSIFLQGRNGSGGNWQTLGESGYGNIWNSTNVSSADSLFTMTSGAIFHISLTPAVHYQYRVGVTGTANDTTTVSFDYLINYYIDN